MKRAILLFAATAMLSAPMFAQSQVKVDKAGLLKKIEKSDADAQNPKKSTSGKYWIDRGNLFYDIQTAYTKSIFEGVDAVTAKLMFGEPAATEQITLPNGQQLTKNTYNGFVTYANAQGQVKAWEVVDQICEQPADKAVEAYVKAFELEPKQKEKISTGLHNVTTELLKDGGCQYAIANYAGAGDNFAKVWEISNMPAYGGGVDTMAIYNSGLAYLFAENYPKSFEGFAQAEKYGYKQGGEVYYLMYHSYKNQFPQDTVKLTLAEEFLNRGMNQYPENDKIIECLTDLYVSIGKDPESIVPNVEAAIAKDPTNASLWNGLGRIYDKLGNLDKSIECFAKVAELMPDNAIANYSVGLLYIRKADKMSNEIYSKTLSPEEYKAENRRILETYEQSVEPLEKAYELNKEEAAFVELLKNVYFRLRDTEGKDYMARYEKYNEIWKAMRQ